MLAAIQDDAKGLPRIVVISASTDPHSDLLNAPLWTSASSFGDRLNIASQTRGQELMITVSCKASIKHNLLRSLHLKKPLRLIPCSRLSGVKLETNTHVKEILERQLAASAHPILHPSQLCSPIGRQLHSSHGQITFQLSPFRCSVCVPCLVRPPSTRPCHRRTSVLSYLACRSSSSSFSNGFLPCLVS